MKVRVGFTVELDKDMVRAWKEFFELMKYFDDIPQSTKFSLWLREEIVESAKDGAYRSTYPDMDDVEYYRRKKDADQRTDNS